MNRGLKVLLILLLVSCIGASLFFNATPAGRAMWNNWFFAVQKADDATRYSTRKEVEDKCRSMMASYTSDKLTYELYKDDDSEETLTERSKLTKVCFWNGYLNGEKIIYNKYNLGLVTNSDGRLNDGWYVPSSSVYYYPYRNAACLTLLDIGVFSLAFTAFATTENGRADIRALILLNSPYLATINNLPTPVEKTADKTMKITYIIREE